MSFPKNILVIMMDGCPAERLSLYGWRKEVTPNIERLRDRALVMRNNFGVSNPTLPTYISMMTGVYPVWHKACGTYSYYDGKYKVLPEYFSEAGYQSFTVFNNVAAFSPELGIISGFDLFYRIGKRNDWFKDTTEEKHGIEKPSLKKRILRRFMSEVQEISPEQHFKIFAAATLDAYKKKDMGGAAAVGAFERFLGERDTGKPFFGVVWLPDTHSPYIAPEPFMSKMGIASPSENAILLNFHPEEFIAEKRFLDERDKADLSKMLDANVAYVDALVGRMVGLLEEKQLFDDTLIVLASDHGGHAGERRNYIGSGGFSYNNVIKIPFILVNAGKTGEETSLTSSLDVFPTLLQYAGLGHLICETHGKDVLTPGFSGHNAVLVDYPTWPDWLQKLGLKYVQEVLLYRHTNRTLVTSDLKKLIWLSTGQHEYYDLKSDPLEQRNLFGWDNPETVAAISLMREKYREYIGGMADHLEYYDFNDYGYGNSNVPDISIINPSYSRMRIIDMEKKPEVLPGLSDY